MTQERTNLSATSEILPMGFPSPVPTLLGMGNIFLKALSLEDASERYCSWMNDPMVVRYTESRFRRYTLEDLKEYVVATENDSAVGLWAICEVESNVHVGNIKLGPVNWVHRFGDMGLILGASSVWGRGYATEAISLVCDYAFDRLKLNKITANMYAENVGSEKAFIKAGFKQEGLRRSQYLCDGKYTDLILMGRLRGEP